MFLFLRNSSHICACDWGPSEFKNLHGVVHCTQYKTGMCLSKLRFDCFLRRSCYYGSHFTRKTKLKINSIPVENVYIFECNFGS